MRRIFHLFVVNLISFAFIPSGTSIAQETGKGVTEARARIWRQRATEVEFGHAAQHLTPAGLQTYNYSIRAALWCESKGHDAIAWKFLDRAITNHPYYSILAREVTNDESVTDHVYIKAFAAILNEVARINATSPCSEARSGESAVCFAKLAMRLHSAGKAYYLDTLAAGYAEEGDFDAASVTEEKAIDFVFDGDYERAIRERLKLYKDKQPYRRTRDVDLWPTIADQSGRFHTEGRLTRFDGEKVAILKKSGDEVLLPIDRLDKEYQDILRPALDANYAMPEKEKWDFFFHGEEPLNEFVRFAEAVTREHPRSAKRNR